MRTQLRQSQYERLQLNLDIAVKYLDKLINIARNRQHKFNKNADIHYETAKIEKIIEFLSQAGVNRKYTKQIMLKNGVSYELID